MARLTPKQLQEARREKAEEKAHAEREAAEQTRWLVWAHERHGQLTSVVSAVYDEVDKLSRKWPTGTASQLMVDKTNKAIQAVKELMQEEEDDFVDDIVEIVPAGDLPEMRDMTLVLGQLKAALQRFGRVYLEQWRRLSLY